MVRPARALGIAAVTATLLLLTACSADDGADAGASPSPSGGASATAPEPTDRDAPLDANQACAAMYVHGDPTLESRIGTALVGASDGLDGTSADQMHALAVELGRLGTRVPDEFQGPVEKIRVPFLQLQEGLDLGTEQEIELDVASTVEGLKEYEALC
ncbi:hypothetical protein ACIG47_02540 [Promicromonospora sp. NPDC052451]|uniref:hypothetical protein n=1 Tax=unclassified Promicromonospora TaxID=2647929 RepID=UPI0037C4F138